jgi:hypothetical protein
MHRLLIFFVLSIFSSGILLGQFPNTSIIMFDFEMDGDTVYLDNPRYLSGFNPEGYNNQPTFFNSKEVYLSTNMYNDTLTEIARLDLNNNNLYRVTETIESEFSPTLSPDPNYFSTVRIERNGRDQSLWLYPVDRSSYGRRLLEDLENVGYHLWLSEDEVALFLVTNPVSLALANVKTGEYTKKLENIGRCMRLSQNGEIMFVHKLSEESWYIKSLDPSNNRIKILTKTLKGREDFELLPDGSIVMGDGPSLFRYVDSGVNAQWEKIDDFSGLGIKNVTRMAISEDKLIIVDVR